MNHASLENRKIHHILHSAFDKAIVNDIVHRNVAKGVDLPRMNTEVVKSFTVDEQNRFFEAARDNRLYSVFLVCVDTGLRTGELLALEWSDIDFAQKYISVTNGLTVVYNRSPDRKTKIVTIVLDSLKTETSVRLVPLTNRSYKMLLTHYKCCYYLLKKFINLDIYLTGVKTSVIYFLK